MENAEYSQDVRDIVDRYREKKRLFELFLNNVQSEFLTSPALNTGVPSVIHSIKIRLKDEGHLEKKIVRKIAEGREINRDNIFSEITDFAGLRVLHLHQNQFSEIHKFIMKKVSSKYWKLLEKPIAYTWDPESVEYFKKFKVRTSIKASYYTSVHYLISPANDENNVSCEIQVRTLFEEAWGEIDHSINYPEKTDRAATVEQLRVLSKLVSTGSRLADAIFKIHGAD
ncbi:TPA: RelA/SpoT domain-containing protein [Pseudomonas aeruginosa]|uniref:RelA/SpoT domain-containing protein n=1 Tax=Pseudomonas aeruginosa TaxID=287 RepID=UPI0009A39DDC|nr:RelA/SpoT domain-containing protein [Pseudomonas aeruginosa]EKX6237971.1 RelA/SpoT domain-containing protein [Pseudomonas aeruginosa]EMD8981511.1 RelA/SpoT domain-containing protein [Pseudomonas aeruginosa]MBH9067644.1 RelA/SpoT domain-containing protein [Pseudomonas aeruginosa]MBI8396615.1 RelA/SpoT domain-containing protein [Pseudomonas aeruginosa]MCY0417333.1 RelA/SpoT domain-containing protein [Pseudomonas aeruginosa]